MNNQTEIFKLLLECIDGWGGDNQPLTVGILKEIIKEALEKSQS